VENMTIHLCNGDSCKKKGGKKTAHHLQEAIRARGLDAHIQIATCGCLKKCDKAPVARIAPLDVKVKRLTPKKMEKVLSRICAGTLAKKK
jgi:NADH:ubiquinone oxidoreductase subunit E